MSGASGAATPIPGSMMPTNPETARMMEPIGGANVQQATEEKGGQPDVELLFTVVDDKGQPGP